jgi:hypothetical protein
MALEQKDLVEYTSADIFAEYPQVSMHERIVAEFGTAAGADLLARCTPVGFNSTTGYYGEWLAADPTILTVDIDGSTGGTWGLTVDGIVIANTVFAHNATAALVEATILASTGIVASVDLTAGVYTITFDAPAQVSAIVVAAGDVTQLTGGTTPTAVETAGTSTYGLSTIVGFVWPDEIQLSATLTVQDVIMTQGRISYTYISPTVAVGDVTALAAELKANAMSRGIIVEDLPQIH